MALSCTVRVYPAVHLMIVEERQSGCRPPDQANQFHHHHHHHHHHHPVSSTNFMAIQSQTKLQDRSKCHVSVHAAVAASVRCRTICETVPSSKHAVSRPVGCYHLHPPLLIYTQNTTHPLDVKKIFDVERDSLSANRRVIIDCTVVFDVRTNRKRHRPQLQTMNCDVQLGGSETS